MAIDVIMLFRPFGGEGDRLWALLSAITYRESLAIQSFLVQHYPIASLSEGAYKGA